VETTITEEPIAGIVDIDFNGTFSGIDTYTSSPPTTGYELSGKVVITASESFLNMGPRLISYYGTDAQWGEPDFQPAATTVLPIKFLGVRTWGEWGRQMPTIKKVPYSLPRTRRGYSNRRIVRTNYN
jgi:hypothetical protein